MHFCIRIPICSLSVLLRPTIELFRERGILKKIYICISVFSASIHITWSDMFVLGYIQIVSAFEYSCMYLKVNLIMGKKINWMYVYS